MRPRRPAGASARPLNFTVRRRQAERDSVGTLQNENRGRIDFGKGRLRLKLQAGMRAEVIDGVF